MLRAGLSAVLVSTVLCSLSVGSAQEASGSVRGRLYYAAEPSAPVMGGVALLPAEIQLPIPIDEFRSQYLVDVYPSGAFAFSNVAEGEYLLAVPSVNPDYLPSFAEKVEISDAQGTLSAAASRIRLSDGEQLEKDIAIVAPDVAPENHPTVTPRYTGQIVGNVEVAGLRPAGSLQLTWLPADAERPIRLDIYSDNRVAADDDGNFSILGLADGEYFLVPPLGTTVLSVREGRDVEYVDFRLFVGGLTEPSEADHEHETDDSELVIPPEGLVTPLPVIPVTVRNGDVSRAAFEIEFPQPKPVPAGLPSAGVGPADQTTSVNYAGALLAGLALVCLAAPTLVLAVRRRRDQ